MEMHSREEVDNIKLVLGQRCWLVGLEFLQELPLLGANNEPVCYVPVLQVGQCNLEAKVTIILHTPHHTTHTHHTQKSLYMKLCVNKHYIYPHICMFKRMCKCLGPIQVRQAKCTLLLPLSKAVHTKISQHYSTVCSFSNPSRSNR